MGNGCVNDRSGEFWTPEPIFAGLTVFCLASGPSLTQAIADRIKGRAAIVCNSSCDLAPWARVLFFMDNGWFAANRETVAIWPGHVITLSKAAKRELPDKVRRVRAVGDPMLPPVFKRAGEIQQGRSTGHAAVSLAIAAGAARVVLVGYDMRLIEGREHHHQHYAGRPRDLEVYARDFVPAFNGWAAAAASVGAEILNATPGSAITEFPFVELDEVLSCNPS